MLQIAGLTPLPDADVLSQIPDPEIKISEEGESHAEVPRPFPAPHSVLFYCVGPCLVEEGGDGRR